VACTTKLPTVNSAAVEFPSNGTFQVAAKDEHDDFVKYVGRESDKSLLIASFGQRSSSLTGMPPKGTHEHPLNTR